ncbi:acetate kinase [Agaribacter flavus]|uniref:Acetate kinase n=1 Tax=Agaribacter flavus TaxID=1902781 RepID=A0ABV7FTQ8_9ALTE
MSSYVLVLNCGSSSIKFAIVAVNNGESILSGLAENLGSDNSTLKISHAKTSTSYSLPANCKHESALSSINNILNEYQDLKQKVVAIGHRVVHGGEIFTQATLIDDEVKAAIKNTSHMAPLHNPANLSGIESAQLAFPALQHVAVFDTAFFQTMPKHAYLYALPYELYKTHGIRRYGFHGSSHEFVSTKAAELLNQPLEVSNLITAHLGNGCSITAINQGKAIDTSLGLTPLEGLVMGTRCGDLDPSIPTYMQETLGYSASKVNDLLNKSSGLLGISELSNDCRLLEEQSKNGNELAQLALEIFCYRLAKYIASYMVASGPLDALVFTGGIGENSSFIRQRTIAMLSTLNFSINEQLNEKMRFGHAGFVQQEASHKIIVIPTNEEWVIANKAAKLTLASGEQ